MAGRKNFVAGEILTAADVNSFLMDQSVMVFDDSAARTTAIPTPSEGMVTYLKDTDAVEKFDGSAFVAVAPDIPGIGSNVVQTVKTNVFSTTSSTYTNITGLSVTITPSSTSSKVLVLAQIAASRQDTGDRLFGFRINGGGAENFIGDAAGVRERALFFNSSRGGQDGSAGTNLHFYPAIYLASPNTTSPVTFTVQGKVVNGSTLFINRSRDDQDRTDNGRVASSITAIEVSE